MGRRWRAGAAAGLAALLAAAGPAHADTATAPERVVTADGRVLLRHADHPSFGVAPDRHRAWDAEPRTSLPRGRAGLEPAQTWCGEPRSTDDVEHGRTTLARHKVVYVHAAGSADRFPQFADRIQKTAGWVAGKFHQGTGGRLGIRFDYGTSCGPQFLDVVRLQVPAGTDTLREVTDRVLAARGSMGLDRGVWDWLVFADIPTTSASWAETFMDASLSTEPDPRLSPHARPDHLAVLWREAFDGIGEGYTAYAATHEIVHTLGAVLPGAPHVTSRYHCTDGISIMCYDDGSSEAAQYSETACPAGADVPTTLSVFDATALDCGGDDYASLAPSGWLAGHWNIVNHPAACAVDRCLASTIEPLAGAVTAPGSGVAGSAVRFTSGATDRDGSVVRFEWDLDGDGAAEHVTGGPELDVVPRRSGSVGGGRVTVVDDTGLTDTAQVPSVPVAGRPPVMVLRAGPAAPSGEPVVLDASASADPDEGGRIVTYRFALPDGRVVEGAAPSTTYTPARPGRFEATVTGIDDEGRSARASVAFDVLNRAPRLAPQGPGRVGVGSDARLRAGADDPDGRVARVAWDLDGDGRAELEGEEVVTRFDRSGRRTVRVVVTDDLGAEASAELRVDVAAVRVGGTTARRSPLRSARRTRSGAIVTRLWCPARRACRYRLSAGGARRDVVVGARATRTAVLRLARRQRSRTVRLVVTDRATGRRLVRRTLRAPGR